MDAFRGLRKVREGQMSACGRRAILAAENEILFRSMLFEAPKRGAGGMVLLFAPGERGGARPAAKMLTEKNPKKENPPASSKAAGKPAGAVLPSGL
jgi:hypothetical protein